MRDLDVAPRRVRTAFAQMLLQLAATGLTLEEIAAALSARVGSPPAK